MRHLNTRHTDRGIELTCPQDDGVFGFLAYERHGDLQPGPWHLYTADGLVAAYRDLEAAQYRALAEYSEAKAHGHKFTVTSKLAAWLAA